MSTEAGDEGAASQLKPVITIKYCGGAGRFEPPIVDLPEELKDKVEVVTIDATAEEFRFLDYNGVTVYRTYRYEDRGEILDWSSCYFSHRSHLRWEADETFDADELPMIPEAQLAKYETLFPEDDGDFDYKRVMAYAIDQGWLTQSGLDYPDDEDDLEDEDDFEDEAD